MAFFNKDVWVDLTRMILRAVGNYSDKDFTFKREVILEKAREMNTTFKEWMKQNYEELKGV